MAQQRNPEVRDQDKVDPEMLKNLELLMNMDVLEQEPDWDNIENMDQDKEVSEESNDEA